MKVWLVEYLIDQNVGAIGKESIQDSHLAHIAYCKEDALKWAVEHQEWYDGEDLWHWLITPREVGKESTFGIGEHFMCDGTPCRSNGTITGPWKSDLDNKDIPDKFVDPLKDKFADLETVAIEDIEQAYEDDARNKFASIANRLADKLDKMGDIMIELANDFRQEFPEEV